MRPGIVFLIVVLSLCFTIIAICGACVISSMIEARRDLEQKEQTEKVIKVMTDVAEKIPEFRLLNRRKGKNDPVSNSPRSDRFFGR